MNKEKKVWDPKKKKYVTEKKPKVKWVQKNVYHNGSKQEQYKQVGNAVPPLLGRALAIKIKELLKNEEV